jgi:hypothetical protein
VDRNQIGINNSGKQMARARSDSNAMLFQSMDVDVLFNLLKEAKTIHDEADILHYLYETKYFFLCFIN